MNSDISSFIKQRERGKKGCRPRHWMGEREEGRKMLQNSRNEGDRKRKERKDLVGRKRKKRAGSQEVGIKKGTRQLSK